MELIVGTVSVESVDTFLGRLREIGERVDSHLQAIDARFVAGERHLVMASELAQRARDRGEAIADDPALEILLYAAGTRQIERALALGVSTETETVAIVIDGGDERSAADAIRDEIIESEAQFSPDRDRILDWFDVTEAELAATDASLEALVCERVALLTVDR